MKIIEVLWVDSSMEGGRVWHRVEDIRASKLVEVRSVGFLIHEDKRSLTIAAHVGGPDAAGAMKIPKGAVTRRRIIGVRK